MLAISSAKDDVQDNFDQGLGHGITGVLTGTPEMNRAFSASISRGIVYPGALPQARDEFASSTLNKSPGAVT